MSLRSSNAAKLNGTMEDIDLNFDDFIARINSDLVVTYVNIASLSAVFLVNYFSCSVANITLQSLSLQVPEQFISCNTGLFFELF